MSDVTALRAHMCQRRFSVMFEQIDPEPNSECYRRRENTAQMGHKNPKQKASFQGKNAAQDAMRHTVCSVEVASSALLLQSDTNKFE